MKMSFNDAANLLSDLYSLDYRQISTPMPSAISHTPGGKKSS